VGDLLINGSFGSHSTPDTLDTPDTPRHGHTDTPDTSEALVELAVDGRRFAMPPAVSVRGIGNPTNCVAGNRIDHERR
jgi:hypothetical protein